MAKGRTLTTEANSPELIWIMDQDYRTYEFDQSLDKLSYRQDIQQYSGRGLAHWSYVIGSPGLFIILGSYGQIEILSVNDSTSFKTWKLLPVLSSREFFSSRLSLLSNGRFLKFSSKVCCWLGELFVSSISCSGTEEKERTILINKTLDRFNIVKVAIPKSKCGLVKKDPKPEIMTPDCKKTMKRTDNVTIDLKENISEAILIYGGIETKTGRYYKESILLDESGQVCKSPKDFNFPFGIAAHCSVFANDIIYKIGGISDNSGKITVTKK